MLMPHAQTYARRLHGQALLPTDLHAYIRWLTSLELEAGTTIVPRTGSPKVAEAKAPHATLTVSKQRGLQP